MKSLKNNAQMGLEAALKHRLKHECHARASASTEPEPLKIIIMYEGLFGLSRAEEMWSRVMAQFDGQARMQSSAWHFALLRDPRLYAQAMQEATHADLILVSKCTDDFLPKHIMELIDASISRKKGRRDALVVLSGGSQVIENSPAVPEDWLHKMGRLQNIDVLTETRT